MNLLTYCGDDWIRTRGKKLLWQLCHNHSSPFYNVFDAFDLTCRRLKIGPHWDARPGRDIGYWENGLIKYSRPCHTLLPYKNMIFHATEAIRRFSILKYWYNVKLWNGLKYFKSQLKESLPKCWRPPVGWREGSEEHKAATMVRVRNIKSNECGKPSRDHPSYIHLTAGH